MRKTDPHAGALANESSGILYLPLCSRLAIRRSVVHDAPAALPRAGRRKCGYALLFAWPTTNRVHVEAACVGLACAVGAPTRPMRHATKAARSSGFACGCICCRG